MLAEILYVDVFLHSQSRHSLYLLHNKEMQYERI